MTALARWQFIDGTHERAGHAEDRVQQAFWHWSVHDRGEISLCFSEAGHLHFQVLSPNASHRVSRKQRIWRAGWPTAIPSAREGRQIKFVLELHITKTKRCCLILADTRSIWWDA